MLKLIPEPFAIEILIPWRELPGDNIAICMQAAGYCRTEQVDSDYCAAKQFLCNSEGFGRFLRYFYVIQANHPLIGYSFNLSRMEMVSIKWLLKICLAAASTSVTIGSRKE